MRWGVLGAAKIFRDLIGPAFKTTQYCELSAIASRDIDRAKAAAAASGAGKAFGSYEALLADPDIDVIYNPLPNHLHAYWTIRALEAGKRADVVIWNKDPFSIYALTQKVFIDGALTYDRHDPRYKPKSDFLVGQPGEGTR